MENCKHEYKEVKKSVLDTVIRRFDYKPQVIVTLEQEEVLIFCTKCGDSKVISPAIKVEYDGE